MAITLTTTSTKIKETTIYSSGNVKAYIRTYARYITPQDKVNNQTNIVIEERFYYQNTGGAYAFDNGISKVRINTDPSGQWTRVDTGYKSCSAKTEYSIQTTTRPINHETDGTSPTITIQIYWKDTLFNTEHTDSVEIKVPKIDRYPMLDQVDSFNDTQNPTISYSTVLGFDNAVVSAGIFDLNDNVLVAYRQVNVPEGSYTFNLTESERNTLLQAFLGTPPYQIKYKLKTSVNNTDYISEKTATFSVINDDAVISYTSTENNAKVSTEVGANYYVQNASNKNITITLQAKKYNTISNVILIHSNTTYSVVPTTSGSGKEKTYTAIFSNIPILTNIITINYQGSRNKNITQSETFTNYITYSKADITKAEVDRPSPTSNNVVIKSLEAVFTQTFNSITNTATLTYKIDNGSETTIPSTEYTISNNKLTLTNFVITNGLPYTDNGNMELKLVDKLTQDIENRSIKKGVPTFDYGEHDLQVNGELYIADTDRNNAKEIRDLIYPVGSIYMSVNPTSPTTLFGGTWERIGVGRTLISAGGGTNPIGDTNSWNGYGNYDGSDKTSWFNVGETGGELSHQLVESELPNISGGITFHGDGTEGAIISNVSGHFTAPTSKSKYRSATQNTGASSKAGLTFSFGSNGTHNNVQPYFAVYMWKRTA